MELLFWWKTSFNVFLRSSQHKRPQYFMKLADGTFDCLCSSLLCIHVKVFIKLFRVSKDFRKQIIQKSPKFVQIILKRCSSQQQSEGCLISSQLFSQDSVLVLNSMCFIQNYRLKHHRSQISFCIAASLIAANNYIKVQSSESLLVLFKQLFQVSKLKYTYLRTPFSELLLPV